MKGWTRPDAGAPQHYSQVRNVADETGTNRWQREVYPAIVCRTKREGTDIFFWRESGLRADAVHAKTWGLRGETPVVNRPGQRQSISAASAIYARGAFWFCTYKGALHGERFVELLKQTRRRSASGSACGTIREAFLQIETNAGPKSAIDCGARRQLY